MPYNVDKDLGGDNESNEKWMEGCVEKVMKSGKSKSSAIAICKAQLRKSKVNKKKDSAVSLSTINLDDTIIPG